MDVDIVIAALRTGDKDTVFGIDDATLKDKSAYDYIATFFSKHGALPQEVTVLKDIGLQPIGKLEPVTHYEEKIAERHKFEKIREIGEKVEKAFKKTINIDDATDQMKAILVDLELARQDEGFIEMGLDADRRRDDYLNAKGLGGKIGISSPWEELDDMTMGWCPGTVNIIVGPTEIGKTWALIKQFEHTYKEVDSGPPLLISIELVCQTVARRADSIYSKVSYGDLRRGDLDVHSEQIYFDALTEMKIRDEKAYIVDASRVRTVHDIELMVKRLNPSIVLLDGLYLLKSSVKGGIWESLTDVIRQLQIFGNRTKVPTIATTQFNRSVQKGTKKGDLKDIGYAYSLAQAADIGIAMKQDDFMESAKEMLFEIIKGREFETDKRKGIVVGWDIPQNMEFLSYDEEEAYDSQGDPGATPF